MKHAVFVIFLALALLVPEQFLAAAMPPEVRVLVIDGVSGATISGTGSPLKMKAADGVQEKWIGGEARFAAGPSGIVIRGRDVGGDVLITNAAGRYRVAGRMFRGALAVIWKDKASLMVVDHISMEDYLSGLINSEISSSWPKEAVKAQAVTARTYAMRQIEGARKAAVPRPYDITSTTLDQVYDGAHQEDPRSIKAVRETGGEFLLRDGAIFPSYYHSCCGGHTEYAKNVWPGESGPPVIDDRYCAGSPKFSWSWQIPISEFLRLLRAQGIPVNIARTIATTPLPDSPRVEMLIIEDDDGMKMVKATELRRIFGYKNVKSTWFEAAIKGGDIVFTGRGYGHGVGMCQWGAKQMAEEGIGYRDILKFYYPDAEVVKLY